MGIIVKKVHSHNLPKWGDMPRLNYSQAMVMANNNSPQHDTWICTSFLMTHGTGLPPHRQQPQ